MIERLTQYLVSENHFANRLVLFRRAIYGVLLFNYIRLIPVADQIWSANAYMLKVPTMGSKIALFFNALHMDVFAPHYEVFLWGVLVLLAFGFIWPRLPFISILIYLGNMILFRKGAEVVNGGHHLLGLLLFYNIFLYLGSSNWWRNGIANFAGFACQLQIAILYLSAGLFKLGGSMWLDGTAFTSVVLLDQYTGNFWQEFFIAYPLLGWLGNYFTLVYQLAFAFLIFIKPIRPWLLLCGFIFHLGISLVMGLSDFGFMMMASYTIFYTSKTSPIPNLDLNRFFSKTNLL